MTDENKDKPPQRIWKTEGNTYTPTSSSRDDNPPPEITEVGQKVEELIAFAEERRVEIIVGNPSNPRRRVLPKLLQGQWQLKLILPVNEEDDQDWEDEDL